MSLKYSVLMPYHNRLEQLNSTLRSFQYHYHDRNDYEVIIIVSTRTTNTEQDQIRMMGAKYGVPLLVIHGYECWNPAPYFNKGARWAQGKYLIITNPECMHQTNILAGLDEEFEKDPDCYVMCSCISIRERSKTVQQIIPGTWYQHSRYRNVLIHFCSAISKQQYEHIDGFDEEYSAGMGFDDDDFRNKIQDIVDPIINIITRDDLIAVHLAHPGNKPNNYLELHGINKAYYESKWPDRSCAEQSPLRKTFGGKI